jgi:hypothetical protein
MRQNPVTIFVNTTMNAEYGPHLDTKAGEQLQIDIPSAQ